MAEKKATRTAYGEALLKLGEENPKVVVLDADLSQSTRTNGFGKKYPHRFFNMGIAEANLMGAAAGMASLGLVPFASTFAIFATGRAYEQIRNTIAYADLNVKIAATHAGLTVGEDGGSHQALEDIGLMRGLPHPRMVVAVPADAAEAEQIVQEAANFVGPVYIRLGRADVPFIPRSTEYSFTWGAAQLLRQGEDITICATGYMVHIAWEAVDMLAAAGISAELLNIPFIKPLDKDTILSSIKHTQRVVTVEEHSIDNGLGSALAELIAEKAPCPLERMGVRGVFGESGKPEELLARHGLTAANIAETCRRMVAR
ncbi:MAG: transketolase family protein [Symbiobacteriaceae bacterium]|nr:transketolase family protein [Symbiobacteriaceae bacterium]